MKRFTKLMIAIAVVAMAIPAFSAVENIQVGGDMTMWGIRRTNFFPFGNDPEIGEHFQSSTRVWVKAALTGDVEAMVRLINERVWSDYNDDGDDYEQTILLDLAYLKASGIGIDGLDLTVGRQEIQFGEGLVVGSRYIPYWNYPDGNTWIMAEDLGLQKAFDAIRVDYKGTAPVDATAFMAKIWEGIGDPDNEINLYGLNVGYNFQDVARLEGYYVRSQIMGRDDNVTTLGVRATGTFAGVGLKGEYARQIGEIFADVDNEGWALLLGGQYNFEAAVSGNIHANLNLYSGDDGGSNNTAWTTYYPANVASRIGSVNYAIVTGMQGMQGLQNAQIINLGAGLKPVEKIGIGIDWFNVKYLEDTPWSGSEDAVGNEIDASVTYAYTEDLSFGLQYGILMTGDALDPIFDENPWQLIASAKLAF